MKIKFTPIYNGIWNMTPTQYHEEQEKKRRAQEKANCMKPSALEIIGILLVAVYLTAQILRVM